MGACKYGLAAGVSAGIVSSLCLLLLTCGIVSAKQLPIKLYTTAEGLARDSVNRIVPDSRGFLWFCTDDGLSRFDGYKFTSYTTADGLPSPIVTALLETGSGIYWVATYGGLCRFNPMGSPQPGEPAIGRAGNAATAEKSNTTAPDPMFVVYRPLEQEKPWGVFALIEDHTGVVWCGTSTGLYRLERAGGEWTLHLVEIGMPGEQAVTRIREDHRGALWLNAYSVATGDSGLYRRWPDGRTERYTKAQGLSAIGIKSLLVDREGRLWVGGTWGLSLLVPEPQPNKPVVAHTYTTKEGLGRDWVVSLFQTSDGHIWAGTGGGLSELTPQGQDERAIVTYTPASGVMSGTGVSALAEDRDGNLWIGTSESGAMKLARNGFTTYNKGDGLGSIWVTSVFEDQAGEICASYSKQGLINRFDGLRFTATRPKFPKGIAYFGWGWNQVTLQDHAGDWWLPTGNGLCRFPRVSRVEDLAQTRPLAVYTTKDGLPGDDIFRLFEDSRGDIWIACISKPTGGLCRWDRATQTVHWYREGEGWSPEKLLPVSFCEDGSGNLWVGTASETLVRLSRGRFTAFTAADGLPAGWVYALYKDHAGRLWIATGLGGLARIDDPSADRPNFVTYTTNDGLSSNQVNCITEDQWGRIYAGTGRGLDRLDPATGDIKHYTAADGLFRGELQSALRDRSGALWFGGTEGLSRLVPEPDKPRLPPPVLISGLRVGGIARPLSALGETDVPQLSLGPGQNQLQIDFLGLGFGTGEALQYQYMLEGADGDWGAPTNQRTVNYPNLRSGAYRFLVRAVTADGTQSERPATVAFRILPPIWQRWWFLTPAGMLLGLIVYGIHRYRVARLIELERVRTRIASDLHDDIGSDLSRIALLSEVVRQQMDSVDANTAERLSLIANISRKAVDSMSDIVWAVNPRRDRLRELTQRMRRLASDVFTARQIEFRFHAPLAGIEMRLGADLRREVFLIFKESVNNAVRHSECTRAEIEFQTEGRWLVLKLSDNGKGFDCRQAIHGHGLTSMRERAKNLGGEFEITSNNGQGTTVTLRVPLGH